MLLSKKPYRADRRGGDCLCAICSFQLYVSGLKQIVEKHRDGPKDITLVVIDLKKAYDRIPREEVWRCTRDLQVQ